jgi:hypothetical protein
MDSPSWGGHQELPWLHAIGNRRSDSAIPAVMLQSLRSDRPVAPNRRGVEKIFRPLRRLTRERTPALTGVTSVALLIDALTK